MSSKDKSFLEQRVADRIAEKKEQRASNTEAYVQTLSDSPKVMSPSSSIPQSGKELRALVDETTENAKALGKAADAIAMGSTGAKAQARTRERDELGRFVASTKVAETTNTSLNTLKAVFKDQSEKIIRTLNANNAAQLKAMSRLTGGSGQQAGGGIFDLLGDLLGTAGGNGPKGGKTVPGGAGKTGGGRWGRVMGAGKGFLARGAGMLGTAFEAMQGVGSRTLVGLEEGGGYLSKLPQAGRTVMGSVKSGVSTAAEVGGKALTSMGEYGGKAMSALGDLGSSVRSIAASPAAGKIVGTTSKVLGAAAAPAIATYEAYGAVTDDTKTGSEKAQGVANAAGGLGGSLLGAELGAEIGTAILPGYGTLIGGAMGGIAGYFAGEEFVNSIGTSITGAVEDSGVGEILGKGMAVAMSPFSEDARLALKKDWSANMDSMAVAVAPIAAAASSLTEKMKDYAEATGKASGQLWDSVRGAASTVWSGAKSAGSQVAEGYQKGGISGAVASLGSSATTLGKSASSAAEQVSEGTRLAGATIGAVSEKYESGGRGVGTVSSGKGDKGGVSYGKYQLATNNNSMATFLASAEGKKVAGGLEGLTPGTPEFNAKYKELSAGDGGKAMEDAQHAYMQRTHFEPQAAKLQKTLGMDVGKEDKSVQEAVWSTATQFGPNSSVISNALKGKDLATMTPQEKVSAIQDYKTAHNEELFKSSSADVRASTLKRATNEKNTLLGVADAAGVKPKVESTSLASTKNTPLGAADASGVKPKVESTTLAKAPGPGVIDATKSEPPAATKVVDATSPTLVASVSGSPPSTSTSSSSDTQTPAASATPMPAPLVGPNTPQEQQTVSVSNMPQPTPAQTYSGGGSSGSSVASTQPSIDEVPLQITDLGLVLLNIGHV